MLAQKAVKTKSSSILKNAERIMDKKTRRNYQKMFKETNRRKQRLLEKKETRVMIHEYIEDQDERVMF